MGFFGDRYTWSRNKNRSEATMEMIDRFFANAKMMGKTHALKVEHSQFNHSDHRAIVLEIKWEKESLQSHRKEQMVRMEQSWTNHEGSKATFESSWNANG